MARAKRRIGIKIDMTPMVDVAFLLLIFFMTTTQFKPPEEVSVNLPSCNSEFQVPMSGIIVLTVNHDGNTFIGDESGRAAMVPKDKLLDALVAARSGRPGARIVIKGDKDADYGAVADLIDALQRTKTLRFNLMTELERTDKDKAAAARGGEH
jgi:biopolymer transport protein ExbD